MSARDAEKTARSEARLRGFKIHLMIYFAVMIVVVPVNLLVTPDTPWFVWPMVGWGSLLAIHTAWTMRLFDIMFHRD